MDDPIKQATELAEATGKTVEEVRKFGEFADQLFGKGISNVLGMIGDKLAYLRLELAIKLAEKTKKRLAERGIDHSRYVPVNIGLPLLEKASMEENENLHDLWSNLLTNAADPNYDGEIRKNYVSILSEFEPIDSLIFTVIINSYKKMPDSQKKERLFVREKIAAALNISEDICDTSLRNLLRHGLIKPGIIMGGMSYGGHIVGAYKDLEMFQVTTLGLDFYRAVNF